jgi:hypothetical protein
LPAESAPRRPGIRRAGLADIFYSFCPWPPSQRLFFTDPSLPQGFGDLVEKSGGRAQYSLCFGPELCSPEIAQTREAAVGGGKDCVHEKGLELGAQLRGRSLGTQAQPGSGVTGEGCFAQFTDGPCLSLAKCQAVKMLQAQSVQTSACQARCRCNASAPYCVTDRSRGRGKTDRVTRPLASARGIFFSMVSRSSAVISRTGGRVNRLLQHLSR